MAGTNDGEQRQGKTKGCQGQMKWVAGVALTLRSELQQLHPLFILEPKGRGLPPMLNGKENSTFNLNKYSNSVIQADCH